MENTIIKLGIRERIGLIKILPPNESRAGYKLVREIAQKVDIFQVEADIFRVIQGVLTVDILAAVAGADHYCSDRFTGSHGVRFSLCLGTFSGRWFFQR